MQQFPLSKEDFCQCLALIKEQECIDEEFSKALSTVGDGHFLYGADNKYHKALLIILNKLFRDESDYIGWWLYEDVEKKVWETASDKKTEYNLESPEALYDFLLHNMEHKHRHI